MNESARFRQLEALFLEVSGLPEKQRTSRLKAIKSEYPELLAELKAMLRVHLSGQDLASEAVSYAARNHIQSQTSHFGPWQVVQTLGHGGMGSVYLAERNDGEYDHQVAIKTVGNTSPEIQSRFLHERQLLANLDHPGIARMLDGGTLESGLPYLVMEYVNGADIISHCDTNKLSIGRRLELFIQLCDAVLFAHNRLIVHRDLKPSNVFVDQSGQVKLLDFGISRLIGDTSTGQSTSILTPQFAAPEQLNGGDITAATDVYALGLILCYLMTGRGPYQLEGLPVGEIARVIQTRRARPPSQLIASKDSDQISTDRQSAPARLAAKIKGDLDEIIDTACEPEAQLRYQTVAELRSDLDNLLSDRPIASRQSNRGYRLRLFLKRNRLVSIATAIATAAFLSLSMVYLQSIKTEQLRATQEANRANQVSAFMLQMFDAANPSTAKGKEISARDVLDKGTEKINDELSGQPIVQSQLLRVMGRAYLMLGEYQRADRLLDKAMELSDQSQSDQAVEDMASIHLLLADSAYNLGDRKASAKHSNQAAELIENRFSKVNATYATAISNLGVLQCDASELDACIASHQKVLAIRQQLFDADDHRIGTSYNYLAMAYDHRGEISQAIANFRKSLAILKAAFGDLHPKVIDGKSNLAGALTQAGETDEARVLLEDALASARQVYPEKSANIAGTSLMLVLLLNQVSDFDAALPLAAEVVTLERNARGDQHPFVAYDLNLLGTTLLGLNRVDEAEATFLESESILTNSTDKPDYILMSARHGLGRVYNAQGRFKEAADVLQETFETRLELDGPGSWVTISTRFDMGEAALGLGARAKAIEHFSAVLEYAEREFEATDPRLLKARKARTESQNGS